MKTILVIILLCPMLWSQTKPRVCRKGYALQKDGRCVAHWTMQSWCLFRSRVQDVPGSEVDTKIPGCTPSGYIGDDTSDPDWGSGSIDEIDMLRRQPSEDCVNQGRKCADSKTTEGPYILRSPTDPSHAVHLTNVTIPLDIRYCDQIDPHKLTPNLICVWRAKEMAPLDELLVSPNLPYCDQLSAKDAGQECVMHANELSAMKHKLDFYKSWVPIFEEGWDKCERNKP